MQTKYEVAEVLHSLGKNIEKLGLNTWQLRTLSAIKNCRTAALGGHVDACNDCGNIRISYNSCRNRHCPKCQGHKREDWIEARGQELLPVPYFHLVFTLPSELNTLALHEPKLVYDTLFSAAWNTLSAFGKDKNVLAGMIAILHTWGQNLSLHPHIHCIVPGGGTDKTGKWKNIRADGKFLFPVKAMSKVFRAKYVAEIGKKIKLEKDLRNKLFEKNWVVFAKRPFGNNAAVIEYLGRYTHKIAISNQRILGVDKDNVSFSYKDYKDQGKKKTMVLPNAEFIRRFAQHILPKRFVKIRHYGFLSSVWKRKKLKDLQQDLKIQPKERAVKSLLKKCPCCKKGTLITIEVFGKRGPPAWFASSDSQNIIPHKS